MNRSSSHLLVRNAGQTDPTRGAARPGVPEVRATGPEYFVGMIIACGESFAGPGSPDEPGG